MNRTSRPSHQAAPLRHRFTNAQLFHFGQTTSLSEEISSSRSLELDTAVLREEERELIREIDRSLLLLCISLLDYILKGDHFESVVLRFLAVLGIDEKLDGVFRTPSSYSQDLSKFIKIAQMVVVQRAVCAANDGKFEHPLDILDGMRERFMMQGS